jgi:hypothetical protein
MGRESEIRMDRRVKYSPHQLTDDGSQFRIILHKLSFGWPEIAAVNYLTSDVVVALHCLKQP